MTSREFGGRASRREGNVSLELVGAPSLLEPTQTADAFEFDAYPNINYNLAIDGTMFADINNFSTALDLSNGQSLNDFEAVPILPPQTDTGITNMPQNWAANEQYDLLAYDSTELSLLPVQQNFGYPDPQGCYAAHEAPYFQNEYNPLASPTGAFSTLSLAVIPSNNLLTVYEDQYSTQQYNCVPDSWMLPVRSEAMPCDSTLEQASKDISADRLTTNPQESLSASIAGVPMFPYTSWGFASSDSDSNDGHRDEPKPKKIIKRPQRQQHEQRRQSEFGSACTSAGTPAEPIKYHAGEKPRKDGAKPWVRINANTEGDTRTAKINNWKNQYKYKSLPMGDWASGEHVFRYTQNCNVDFLTDAPMSTGKIREYIMNYPNDDKKQRLILWIQKMPADTSRRYGSLQHAKCVFKDCPFQKYITGTISTGEYRVAFDEKHSTWGHEVDPYDCVAYAHLYCMEQFLDFELICQVADVRVDTRHVLPLEPNERSAFSMVDVPARAEVEKFVKLASKGKLRWAERWANYPIHANYGFQDQKPHEYTLTYLAHCMYEEYQDHSHKKQAALRRVTVSQRRVHLGDLEMACADKRIEQDIFKSKKKGRNLKHDEYYSPRIWENINRAKKEAREFLEAHAWGKKRGARGKPQKGKKSKTSAHEESDHDKPAYSAGTRSFREKKHKTNYAESPDEQQHQYDDAAFMQAQAAPAVQATDVQHLPTYFGQNFGDISQRQSVIDPMLDTTYDLYAVSATPKLDIEDFDDFPACEDDLPNDNLEKLLSLERRQSCADFGLTNILKSPGPVSGCSSRRAGSEAQPVTDSKEYGIDDPLSVVGVRSSGRLRACEVRLMG